MLIKELINYGAWKALALEMPAWSPAVAPITKDACAGSYGEISAGAGRNARTRRKTWAEWGSGNTHKHAQTSVHNQARAVYVSRNQAGRPSVVISEPTIYNNTP